MLLLLLLAGHRWRWILGSFLLLVLPSPVLAWEIYTTEATGAPLRWFQEEVPYAIDENTPAALPREAALAAIEASFVSWDAVDCATLTLRHEGRLPDLRQEVFALARERNAVIFVEEDWPDSTTAVALTWMTYHLRTGAMRDADILLNAEHMAFTVSPAAVAGRHDLQNTVTHEVGHFLGLGHSALPEATMAPEAPPGETRKRDLHADDRAGLCFLYPPPAADALAADTEDTRGGEADRGAERESAADGAGCALAMAPGRGAGTAGALLASLALLLGVCRSFLLRPRRADIVRSAGSDR